MLMPVTTSAMLCSCPQSEPCHITRIGLPPASSITGTTTIHSSTKWRMVGYYGMYTAGLEQYASQSSPHWPLVFSTLCQSVVDSIWRGFGSFHLERVPSLKNVNKALTFFGVFFLNTKHWLLLLFNVSDGLIN